MVIYTGSIIKKRKRHSDSGLSDRQFKGLEKQNFVSITDLQKKAPYYYKTVQLVNEIFEGEYDTITSLNKTCLEKVCTYLGFPKELPIFSQMGMEIETPNDPDEWALNICKKLEGDIHYINPIGGLEFFDTGKYTNNNIEISFQK